MDDNVFAFFVACVMPVAIVVASYLSSMYKEKQRAKVLIKAIECSPNFDTDKLAKALQKPRRTPLDILNKRLLNGCVFSLIGLGALIFGIYMSNCENESAATTSFLVATASLAIGVGFLITYFITRKQASCDLDKEGSNNVNPSTTDSDNQ